jgi:hypothetical protein
MNSRAGRGAVLLALPAVAVGVAATQSSAEVGAHSAKAVTNKFFPLKPGTVFNYRTTGGKKTVVKVLKARKVIQGRSSTGVDTGEFEGGKRTEHFVDWYWQDSKGTVWYMKHRSARKGESWTAGKSGAKRGIMMKAHPKVGQRYKLTSAGGAGSQAGGAGQDRARVYSVSKTRVKIKVTSKYYPETVRFIYKVNVGLYKILDKSEVTTLKSVKKP